MIIRMSNRAAYRPRGLTDEEYALYQSLPRNDGYRMALHFRQAAIDNGVKFSIASYEMLANGQRIEIA